MVKQMKLLKLELTNFKGVKHFVLDANGNDMRVYGDNEAGKTTLFDAFLWLLFGRDSLNSTKFSIKTLDENGNEVNGLNHEVEATIIVDGKVSVLKKVFREKWTRRRGAAEETFDGHTNDYFIDGVPSKQKEFNAFVSELVDEDTFKLLTNPSYFNERLKEEQRRKVLFEACGNITDADVIATNKALANLPSILGDRTIEKHRKTITAKKSEINKELEIIPVRIDEIHRGLPDLSELNKGSLETEIQSIDTQIDGKQDEISSLRNGNAITDKQKAIQEIEIELMQIKQQHETGIQDDVFALKSRIQEQQSELNMAQNQMNNILTQTKNDEHSINRLNEIVNRLRAEYSEINKTEFEHNDACECPTCGQELPVEQVNEAREKALNKFNLEKSEKLERIMAQAKSEQSTIKQLNENINKLKANSEAIAAEIVEKKASIEQLEGQLAQLESQVVDITENAQYVAKLKEKQKLQEEIASLRISAQAAIQEVEQEIVQLKVKRDELQSEVAKFTLVTQANQRIDELKKQQKELAKEYERLEKEIFLMEEFTRTKVDLVEGKIDNKFKYARFRLFEKQVNGTYIDVCKTTYKGVPYGEGLNNAARINVGLDIINTLSEHYGFQAPIFIDNAEAVTKLIETNSQTISLVVSEKDKQLRVETTADKESVVA